MNYQYSCILDFLSSYLFPQMLKKSMFNMKAFCQLQFEISGSFGHDFIHEIHISRKKSQI